MTKPTGYRQLGFAVLVIALLWLVILPRVAQWPPVRSRIERNEAAGIDPSAMFYSELEHLEYRDGMLRRVR